MKQITVISGKGGTGKTTMTAAFASLAERSVFADCDCDAPDLQLVLNPDVFDEEEYIGSALAIRKTNCSMCGLCREKCRYDAIDGDMRVIETNCEGCGVCAYVCPEDAIEMEKGATGTIYKSRTRFGPMVHAELGIGEEASGKMVTQVRKRARELSEDKDFIIIDGSPGIGCPVIASIRGVDAVIVVVEPTVTGMFDMERVLSVTEHFDISASVCINKYDLNEENTKDIENYCRSKEIPILGRFPYDDVATKAMISKQTVVEYSNSELAQKIGEVWEKIRTSLDQ